MRVIRLVAMGIAFAFLISSCFSSGKQKHGDDYMVLYEEANRTGDDEKALEYLQLAVEQKHPEALSRLGEAYLHGRYGLDGPDKAFSLIEDAALAGSARGMTNLGILYLKGTGTDQDYEESLIWFGKAAEAGDMKAPRYIGFIYENGWGQEVDYTQAAYYYGLAADNGDITGQYQLGQLYEKGLGCGSGLRESDRAVPAVRSQRRYYQPPWYDGSGQSL